MYTNYSHFIERRRGADLRRRSSRSRHAARSRRGRPGRLAEWRPDVRTFCESGRELKYVLRAYGDDGKFDETRAAVAVDLVATTRAASIVAEREAAPMQELSPAQQAERTRDAKSSPRVDDWRDGSRTSRLGASTSRPVPRLDRGCGSGREHAAPRPDAQLLAGYGESDLALQNIRSAAAR